MQFSGVTRKGSLQKKKTTKVWTLSKPLLTPPPPPLVWTLKVWTVRKGSDPPLPPKVWTLGFKKFGKRQMALATDKVPIGVGYEPVEV